MIRNKTENDAEYVLGMIGLGTMGRNLLLNMADHGYSVSGYDSDPKQVAQFEEEGIKSKVKGFSSLEEFVNNLKSPRIIMLLVPAGKIVDEVIQEVLPFIDEGDIIIDGGNSYFKDTDRRVEALKRRGYHFFGVGISGGEEGARFGPSMMPGGDKEAYEVVKPIFEAISAKVNKEPCVVYIGPGASGHFVKMVHNGIEYALMELIAETYELFRRGLAINNHDIGTIFGQWNEGKLKSYLLEITKNIFRFKEPGTDHLLLDDILDVARAKGTGKWTSQIAMDLVLPISVIDTAVSLRDLSKYKSLRTMISSMYPDDQIEGMSAHDHSEAINTMEEAFYFCMIIAYSQGLHLLSKASEEYGYGLKLGQIAKIWRGGCIIRSEFLDVIYDAFEKNPQLEHLIVDPTVRSLIKESLSEIRTVLTNAVNKGVALPAYASSLSYFDALRSKDLPANLIQAQRDYFGAHTYELIDKEGKFHTHWEG